LCAYLDSLGYREPRILREVRLGGTDEQELKGFGYGKPVLLELESQGKRHQLVIHTLSPDSFGHDRMSDRAESLLLAHHTFNRLPRHVASLDVGTFTKDAGLISLGGSEEFFLLTEFAPGRLYASDLERIRDSGKCDDADRARARELALYLARIHGAKHGDPLVYRRRIRDLVGHGEGIMGLLDSYPLDRSLVDPSFLEKVEHAVVAWRWKLKPRVERLSQVHGDFHPFNILFQEDASFRLLDRSRGEWGEPADDVTALSINYIFFALQSGERFEGPLRSLFELFWKTYLDETGDDGVLETAPPFFAWRGLVVASPVWYPSISQGVRVSLFRFIENVMADPQFDPSAVSRYLELP
jgi:hypothetical protein